MVSLPDGFVLNSYSYQMFLAYEGEHREDYELSEEHYDAIEELMDENGKPITT